MPADSANSSRIDRVFLCHSSGDKAQVRNLYKRLKDDGFHPWLDEEDLLAGQEWSEEIQKAVRSSAVVLVCLSPSSITKVGYVQKEIKYALDVADEQPEGNIFVIPVKLQECSVPSRLNRWQWVNLFEGDGYAKLLLALHSRLPPTFAKRTGLNAWIASHKVTLAVAVGSLLIVAGVGVAISRNAARNPTSAASSKFSARPKVFKSITLGSRHLCALTSDGAAYCWGDSSLLGNTADATGPEPVLGGHVFKILNAGTFHTCGITTEGELYCWGYDATGGSSSGKQDLPVPVAGLLRFQSVAVGQGYSCAVTVDGRAYCWGDNRNGQLGNGTNNFASAPVPVSGNLQFRSVSAGQDHTCGLTTDGSAYCWGSNNYAALATGDGVEGGDGSSIPRAVATSHKFIEISASEEWSTCGLTSDGEVYCWGAPEGRLEGKVRFVPTRLNSHVIFKSISAGIGHKCGVSDAGEGYCWGNNSWGELGDGTQTASAAPARVQGHLQFAIIVTGRSEPFTCGLTTAGTVYCWGSSDQEGLGGKNYPVGSAVVLPTEVLF